MRTLLLLAGRSRRFWPLSEKALWPFLGKPLLQYQLERLQGGGLADITFVGGQHNVEQVHDLFPRVPSIEQENPEDGMRGAILSALQQLKADTVCIVSNNDVIEPEGYKALLEVSREEGVDGAILAQRVKRYFPGGYLITGDQESGLRRGFGRQAGIRNQGFQCPRVMGVIEKPGEGHEPSDLVNIVAHVHNRPERLKETLEEASSGRDDAYEVALTMLCKELNYVAVPYEGRWDAVKYPWHILDLTERFLGEMRKCENAKMRKCEVHPTAVIEGHVVLEEGVKVLPHATIQGPCYIGKNTIIGTGALVRNSIIGEDCVIGFGSEIVRSNLHSHVWTHSAYLGDSVIGRNVAFGAGTTSANFRLDEGGIQSVVNGERISTRRAKLGVIVGDDVRCGVQTVFAPGVKVGSGSFINSATSVTEDVQENRFVTVKEGVLEERENKAETPGVRR